MAMLCALMVIQSLLSQLIELVAIPISILALQLKVSQDFLAPNTKAKNHLHHLEIIILQAYIILELLLKAVTKFLRGFILASKLIVLLITLVSIYLLIYLLVAGDVFQQHGRGVH